LPERPLRRGHPGAGESPRRPTHIVPAGLIGRFASRDAVCRHLTVSGWA
jgi:hypothetical protein